MEQVGVGDGAVVVSHDRAVALIDELRRQEQLLGAVQARRAALMVEFGEVPVTTIGRAPMVAGWAHFGVAPEVRGPGPVRVRSLGPSAAQGEGCGLRATVRVKMPFLLPSTRKKPGLGGEVGEVPHLLAHNGIDAVEDAVRHVQDAGLVLLGPRGVSDRVDASNVSAPYSVMMIGFIGFDNIFSADLITPGLTTVALPQRALGGTAVHNLLAIINGALSRAGEPMVMPTRLIQRASTARRRRGSRPTTD